MVCCTYVCIALHDGEPEIVLCRAICHVKKTFSFCLPGKIASLAFKTKSFVFRSSIMAAEVNAPKQKFSRILAVIKWSKHTLL